MTVKSSQISPLHIAEVLLEPGQGSLGMTLCPGKKDAPRNWCRDLGEDLRVIRDWNATTVVTLIEDHEFRMLGVDALGHEVRALGMDWVHLPIVDVNIPDHRFENAWAVDGPNLHARLDAGERVLIHCRGGLGRTGLVAALILIERGCEPHIAVQRVRAVRPHAIETPAQEQYVLNASGSDRSQLGTDRAALPSVLSRRAMDWFQEITGFCETTYVETQRQLQVVHGRLSTSTASRTWGIGTLEAPTLAELRDRVSRAPGDNARTTVRCLAADARQLHSEPDSAGALFQVASQFNLLEMVGPDVTPEHGVTRYQNDHTQGPACAIAAGAATIYRNYLLPVADGIGQRKHAQIDCLQEIGRALGNSGDSLWEMRNGYALCTFEGLAHIDRQLACLTDEETDALRGMLRIGLHWNVEVTDAQPGHYVSQAFCSALPVAYTDVPLAIWSRFATLVLEAAYEATLLAGRINAQATGCRTVFLTRLGHGAFGNDVGWIHAAIGRAVRIHSNAGLDVRLVTFGPVSSELTSFVGLEMNKLSTSHLDRLVLAAPRSPGIYRLFNLSNGKSYVGQAANLRRRLTQHLRGLLLPAQSRSQPKLRAAFRKYAPECWMFEILERCQRTQLTILELRYAQIIDVYAHGYNCAPIQAGIGGTQEFSEIARQAAIKINASFTPEQRSQHAKKAADTKRRMAAAARRSDAARKAAATRASRKLTIGGD